MKWIFILLFSSGMLLFYRGIVSQLSRSRIHQVNRIPGSFRIGPHISFWEKWLINKSNTPGNEKLKVLLKKAGLDQTKHYLSFKLIEWIWPIFVLLFVSVLHSIGIAKGKPVWDFPYTILLVWILFGWFALHGALRWKAAQRVSKIGLEIIRFSDRLLMSLSMKTSLYYGIKRAGRTTRILKPYIDLLLIEWSQENPKKAINRFMNRVASDEMIPLTNAMLVITDNPEKAQYLMEQQMKNIEVIRDFAIKQRIKAKPVYMIMLVAIPFTAAMIALIAPWYYETVKQLQSML